MSGDGGLVKAHGHHPRAAAHAPKGKWGAISGAINAFFYEHEIAWESFMIVLAIVFVSLGFVPDWTELSPQALETVFRIEDVITAIFVLEFVIRISAAPSKLNYLRGRWLDLLALLPAIRFLRMARGLRVLRLLRLLVLFRLFASLDRVTGDLKVMSARTGLQWALFLIVVVMIIGAEVMYVAEQGINPNLHSYWDAIWWAVVTLATVGYGDIYPVTVLGRVIAMVLMVLGVGLWAMTAATLAAHFVAPVKSSDPAIHELKKKLDHIDELTETELVILRVSFLAVTKERLERRKHAVHQDAGRRE